MFILGSIRFSSSSLGCGFHSKYLLRDDVQYNLAEDRQKEVTWSERLFWLDVIAVIRHRRRIGWLDARWILLYASWARKMVKTNLYGIKSGILTIIQSPHIEQLLVERNQHVKGKRRKSKSRGRQGLSWHSRVSVPPLKTSAQEALLLGTASMVTITWQCSLCWLPVTHFNSCLALRIIFRPQSLGPPPSTVPPNPFASALHSMRPPLLFRFDL